MTTATTKKVTHKRGNTFVRGFRFWADKTKNERLDLTNYTIRSQVKKGATLVETLTVTITDPLLGEFKLSSLPRTDQWPIGDLEWDIELTNTITGQVISTETYMVSCGKGVTGPIV